MIAGYICAAVPRGQPGLGFMCKCRTGLPGSGNPSEPDWLNPDRPLCHMIADSLRHRLRPGPKPHLEKPVCHSHCNSRYRGRQHSAVRDASCIDVLSNRSSVGASHLPWSDPGGQGRGATGTGASWGMVGSRGRKRWAVGKITCQSDRSVNLLSQRGTC